MKEEVPEIFVRALETDDLRLMQQVPKSDLHNHAALGSRFADLVDWLGHPLEAPPESMSGIAEMDQYLSRVLRPLFLDHTGFEYALMAAFRQAKQDGVSVLEMSIDSWFIRQYPGRADQLTEYLERIHAEIAPDICFIPQLGLNRGGDMKVVLAEARDCIATGFFQSIDLYGEELVRPPEDFREIYREAARAGMRLKAHSGEFGDADSVRRHVEVLELQEVQHGISAASSAEVMKWLREQDIRLNVCPTSNVVLQRVSSLKEHPLRVLFDEGLFVTLNSDDIMLFGQSVSEEYLNVYRAGLFSADELNLIRLNGLSQSVFSRYS